MVTADGSLVFEDNSPDGSNNLLIANPTGVVSPLFPGVPPPQGAVPSAVSIGRISSFNTPSYWTLGTWLAYMPDASLASIVGTVSYTAVSAYPENQGAPSKRHAPKKPAIAHFIPATEGDLGTTYNKFETGMTSVVPDSRAIHSFKTGASATPENFLTTLAKPLSAVGYVGHSFDIFTSPPFSIGLNFSTNNSAVVRPPSPTDNPPYTINAPGIRLVPVTQINTQTKVVFIGACYSGPVFESLWNIHNLTASQPQTVGQALIVLKNPSATVKLGHGIGAWENILDDMVNKHMNVHDAVIQTNQYLQTLRDTDGHPITEQYREIGDGSVKINP